MKIQLLPVTLFGAAIAASCGSNCGLVATATAAGLPLAAVSSTPAAPSAAAAKSAARVIEITANDQMKFSLATMQAKAGEELKVVLTNAGTLPKEAMGHNWVLLKAGTDVSAFATAGMTAKETDYIPPAMKDQVIAAIPVLGPKKSADVTFKAPPAGDYTYICSFPGHFMLMKGTLTVK